MIQIMKTKVWDAIKRKKITSREALEVEGREIVLTNIEKELWKGVTKAHLIAYYNTVAPFLLPYLEDRPLALNISPDGPFKESVFIRGHQYFLIGTCVWHSYTSPLRWSSYQPSFSWLSILNPIVLAAAS